MPAKSAPGLSLQYGWALGESGAGVKAGLDSNALALSVLVNLTVKSRVTALPASPANGDRYIVPASASSNANQIAVRVEGAWQYFTPLRNWRARVEDELDTEVVFNGSAWIERGNIVLDASNPGGAQLVTGTAFTKIPLYTVPTDTLSGWDSAQTEYVVPLEGLYQVTGSLRLLRSGTNSIPANQAFAVGVGLSSAMTDSKDVVWSGPTYGTLDVTAEVNRHIRFSTGDRVCLFGRHTYSAGVAYVYAALQMRRVGD